MTPRRQGRLLSTKVDVKARSSDLADREISMPMLMLKCKTCGEVFAGVYVPEGSGGDVRSAAMKETLHVCSRGHKNEYSKEDYMDWS